MSDKTPTLEEIEALLLQESRQPRPSNYPREIFPVITRLHKASVPARRIAQELHRLPQLAGRSPAAIYRRVTRHIQTLK